MTLLCMAFLTALWWFLGPALGSYSTAAFLGSVAALWLAYQLSVEHKDGLGRGDIEYALTMVWDRARRSPRGWRFQRKGLKLILDDGSRKIQRFIYDLGKEARLLRRLWRNIRMQEKLRGDQQSYLAQYRRQIRTFMDRDGAMNFYEFQASVLGAQELFSLVEGDLNRHLEGFFRRAQNRLEQVRQDMAKVQKDLDECQGWAEQAGKTKGKMEALAYGFEQELKGLRRSGVIISMKLMALLIIYRDIQKAMAQQRLVWTRARKHLDEHTRLVHAQNRLQEARLLNDQNRHYADVGIDEEIVAISPVLRELVQEAFNVIDLKYTSDSFDFLNRSVVDMEKDLDTDRLVELKEIEKKVLMTESELVDLSYLVNSGDNDEVNEATFEQAYTAAMEALGRQGSTFDASDK